MVPSGLTSPKEESLVHNFSRASPNPFLRIFNVRNIKLTLLNVLEKKKKKTEIKFRK